MIDLFDVKSGRKITRLQRFIHRFINVWIPVAFLSCVIVVRLATPFVLGFIVGYLIVKNWQKRQCSDMACSATGWSISDLNRHIFDHKVYWQFDSSGYFLVKSIVKAQVASIDRRVQFSCTPFLPDSVTVARKVLNLLVFGQIEVRQFLEGLR